MSTIDLLILIRDSRVVSALASRLIPFAQRTLARPPSGLFGEEAAANSAAVLVAVFADSADRQPAFECGLINLGRAVDDVFGDPLGEIRRHRDLAGEFGLIPLITADDRQTGALMAMTDNGPFRMLAHEDADGDQQTRSLGGVGLITSRDRDQSP